MRRVMLQEGKGGSHLSVDSPQRRNRCCKKEDAADSQGRGSYEDITKPLSTKQSKPPHTPLHRPMASRLALCCCLLPAHQRHCPQSKVPHPDGGPGLGYHSEPLCSPVLKSKHACAHYCCMQTVKKRAGGCDEQCFGKVIFSLNCGWVPRIKVAVPQTQHKAASPHVPDVKCKQA